MCRPVPPPPLPPRSAARRTPHHAMPLPTFTARHMPASPQQHRLLTCRAFAALAAFAPAPVESLFVRSARTGSRGYRPVLASNPTKRFPPGLLRFHAAAISIMYCVVLSRLSS
ncbi:hypothetical protein AK830_g6242 [Neonectria ditissima]|uniref:Uncharacterized protein n=1 Tax=Neonectria ditissima TaxID=78410 RepID=A0A0P7BIZ8_9HYPO|nr:hypothetical protein AK830_g6242 [Neonectria ditissima]